MNPRHARVKGRGDTVLQTHHLSVTLKFPLSWATTGSKADTPRCSTCREEKRAVQPCLSPKTFPQGRPEAHAMFISWNRPHEFLPRPFIPIKGVVDSSATGR